MSVWEIKCLSGISIFESTEKTFAKLLNVFGLIVIISVSTFWTVQGLHASCTNNTYYNNQNYSL